MKFPIVLALILCARPGLSAENLGFPGAREQVDGYIHQSKMTAAGRHSPQADLKDVTDRAQKLDVEIFRWLSIAKKTRGLIDKWQKWMRTTIADFKAGKPDIVPYSDEKWVASVRKQMDRICCKVKEDSAFKKRVEDWIKVAPRRSLGGRGTRRGLESDGASRHDEKSGILLGHNLAMDSLLPAHLC